MLERLVGDLMRSRVRYDAAQALTTDQRQQARANVYAAPLDALAYHGLQINGSHQVSQEHGDTAGSADARYPSDQNFFGFSLSSGAADVQRVTDVPPGYSHSLKLTVTATDTSIAAGEYAILAQSIEGYRVARLGWGAAGAQPIAVGFWVKSSITGTFCVAARNGSYDRAWVGAFTVNAANAWEFKTFLVPGDVTGTWNTSTGIGLAVSIALVAGATLQGVAGWNAGLQIATAAQANLFATNGATFQTTGLIVLPGSEMPQADRAWMLQRTFSEELRLCQRYYQTSYPIGDLPGNAYGSAAGGGALSIYAWATSSFAQVGHPFPTQMRAAPTVVLYSPNTGVSAKAAVAPSPADVDINAMVVSPTHLHVRVGNVSINAGNNAFFHYAANARL